jgi:hypothetical protein
VRRLLVLLIGGLAVGCSSQAPTQPTPTPTAATPTSASPARPREIRLDGVDPCTLLTPSQRKSLGLGGAPQPYTSGPPTPGNACSITGFEPRAVAVDLTVATTVGISAVTAPGAVNDTLTQIAVAGYPAVIARPRNPDGCLVDIDVAQGQLLDVLFRDGGGDPPIPQDQLCRDAVNVAGQTMNALLGR